MQLWHLLPVKILLDQASLSRVVTDSKVIVGGFPFFDDAEPKISWILSQNAAHSGEERYIKQKGVYSVFAHDCSSM